MDRKTYYGVASLVFLVLAVVHGLRVLNGWEVMFGEYDVPMWLSYIVVIAGAYLAWTGYQYRK